MRLPTASGRRAGLVVGILAVLVFAAIVPPGPLHAPTPRALPAPAAAAIVRPAGPSSAPAPVPSPRPHPAVLLPQWTNITATTNGSPPPRISGGMVYDAEDGYLVLFGGTYLNTTTYRTTYYNDTWAFENGRWTNITRGPAPSPREGFGMAFDPEDGEVVLFGGHPLRGPNALNDTWEFSGGTWSNITGVRAPPARYWGSMTYDDADGYVLLFGGLSETFQYLNDSWRFLGGSWSQLRPASAPSGREGAGIASNTVDGDVDLYGGLNTSNYLNDTWTYSGGTWTKAAPTASPDPRLGAGFAFDTAQGVVAMFAGFPAASTPYGTWIFQGGNWTDYNNLPNVPTFNYDTVWGQMAYDSAEQAIVLVPASNPDTYLLNFTTYSGPPPLGVTASVSPLSGPAPLTVQLSSSTTGGTPPYVSTWAPDDGGFLTTGNGSVVYSTPGTYEVVLWVNDSGALTFRENCSVVVLAPSLQASASVGPDPAFPGQTVSYTSMVSGGAPPYAFSWTFGDGASSMAPDPTHSYSAPGIFDVAFTVRDTALRSLFINFTENVTLAPLAVTAAASPLTGVAPFPVAFTATATGGMGPYTYAWQFGVGSAGSSSENASYTYQVVGNYNATLTVKDAAGAIVTKSWTITAEPPPLGVSVSASPTTGTAGENITFTSVPFGGQAPYTYAWSFGGQGTSTAADPSHAFAAAGTYNVTLTIHDKDGSSASAYVVVVVTGGSSASGSTFPVWEIGVIVLIVLVLAALFLFVVWRRRKKEPRGPSPVPAGPP